MIKSQITLKQLEAFAFVIDTGSFRAAASALGTTQPNISARITALETSLGVTLLYRDAGSVRLTDNGTTILAKTREVLWAGESLLEEANRQDLIEERMRLGVTELVACSWLQDFLRLLKQAYPKLRVELEVDLSIRIDEKLKEGQLDLAFQTEPFKSNVSGVLPLTTEHYVWLANEELFVSVGHSAEIAKLFEFTIITHAKHTQSGRALHALAEAQGLDQSQIVHSSSLSACVPLVSEGLGIALLPKALVLNEIQTGRLHILDCQWSPAPLSFFARYHIECAPLYIQKAAQIAIEAVKTHRIRALYDQKN